MLKIRTLLAALLLFTAQSFAQTTFLRGTVADKEGRTVLPGATVRLRGMADTLEVYEMIADKKGVFYFSSLKQDKYSIAVSFKGYENFNKEIDINAAAGKPVGLLLVRKATQLEGVTIVSNVPVKVKGDTLEYSASSFKVNPDANAEDLVRKMPGITVENGTVKAQGENVRKVTVDGRDFFGDDATAALRNLPAEVVDKIQVFDRLSEQAQFTGFDDGNGFKAINIVTRANMRNGQFGRVYAGAGTDERYTAGGNVSFFKGNRRISLIGLANNINQQNFSQQDLLGVMSSGGGGGRGFGGGMRGGGGGRGGGFSGGFGGGGNNFQTGQSGGINTAHSFGLNYSDAWGKKTDVSGSYFFNNSRNRTQETTNQQVFLRGDTSQYYDENSISTNNNFNHRINFRFDHRIDSFNSILITPSLSFQDNSSFSNINGTTSLNDGFILSKTDNTNNRSTNGYSINNGILWRHSFRKRGRTLSVNFNLGLNNKDGETYVDAISQYTRPGGLTRDSLQQLSDQVTDGRTYSGSLNFTELIGKKGQLQISYTPSLSKNKSNQQTYQYDAAGGKYNRFDPSLSNVFDNTVTKQNAGISFRRGDRDKMWSIGLSFQHTELNSEQSFPINTTVNKKFSNLLPNAMVRLKLSKSSNINIFYRANTNDPSISQLQNVINNSNPLAISTGNPDLKQQYGHVLNTRYTLTNVKKGSSFFLNLFLQQNSNYIGNATFIARRDSVLTPTVTLFRGSQLSKPVNLDGFWSVRTLATYGFPVKSIKSNLNWTAGWTYSRTPGIVNSQTSIANNNTYTFGMVVSSNVSQYVDFTLSYSGNYNVIKNSAQPTLDNNYFNQSAGAQVNLLSKKGWFWQTDVTNQSFRGLTDGFNQDYWLWNMSAGKKFLKNQQGELKLSVFDLLKQNQAITRTATETYIEDVRTQVLQQYFMLTFSYRLRNFGKAPTGGNREGGREFRINPDGGRPPMF